LYTSPNIIEVFESSRMRRVGHVARIEGMNNAYRIYVGKSEVKRLLTRRRLRWEDNIKMDLRKIG